MPFPCYEYVEPFVEGHFRGRGFEWSEDYLLRAIEQPLKRTDPYWAAIGLRKVGTERSIPALQNLFRYPVKDVKSVALLTIAQIAREKGTAIYCSALLDAKYPEKAYAIWAINDAADETAIPAVLEYFKKNRSKLRNGKLVNGTVELGVEYLARYADTSAPVREFFDQVRGFISKLPLAQRAELKDHVGR
jgi:hypothetical protein